MNSINTDSFAGKNVLITGSVGGIGHATAERFDALGATLVLMDQDEQGLKKQAQSFRKPAAYYAFDIADENRLDAAFADINTRFGRVDAAFLNAGTVGKVSPIVDQALDAFDRVMAVNLRSVFVCLKHSMRIMQGGSGGSIVITSSTGGVRGSVGLSPYVASKHAVIGLMKSAALEGARHGIRVNTVNPGTIETAMIREIEANSGVASDIRARNVSGIPLKRYGSPAEVAQLVTFLSSDQASFITGASYLIDGGVMAGRSP
ncbi:MAG: SDR family oxidoreductase [Comamonadaceae bacterium]|nr:SDR family oxidoreductase [Comamonadaceae bacterium]